MRRIVWLTFLIVFIMAGSIAGAEPIGVQPGNAYIPDGTNIAVELVNTVSSKKTFVGEVLEVKVLEDIVMNNTVVIEKGAMGYVSVSKMHRAGEWAKNGGIEIQPRYVKSANWIKVPLTQGITVNGEGHKVVRALGIPAILLLYLDVSPGDNAVIPAGTKFIVNVQGDVDLQVTPEELSSAMTIDPNRKGINSIQNKLNWTGTYSTSRGHMVLTQSGNTVTGTYNRNNGQIIGTIEGNKLVGKWTEDPSSVAPSGKGFFQFHLSPSGTSVMMSWRNDYSENWNEDKYANRLSGW